MTEPMAEKVVDSKITECKELIIQNMEQAVQSKMVYMFLKDHRCDTDVKQYTVNPKDGIIKLEFAQHQRALTFYHDYNFVEKILIRPFNIYFNIQLEGSEMKKYYLEGLTEETQRPLFEAAKKLGICKIYSSYGHGSRAKLRTNGILSYFRKEPISEPELQLLAEQLQPLGIKISPYAHDKERKLSLNIANYLPEDLYQQNEEELKRIVHEKAEEIYERYVPGIKYDNLSATYKKREADAKNNKPKKLLSRAVIDFRTVQDAYDSYQKLRVATLSDDKVQVKLYFHSLEANCYSCLVTQGMLKKEEGQLMKQFEDQLLRCYLQINENVVQVSVSQSKHRQILFGKVYFRSEDQGKKFLVDYTKHRSILHGYYSNQLIKFDISLDSTTLKKIRVAIKNGQETTEKVKKQNDHNRKTFQRPPNTYPIPGQPFLAPSSMMAPGMPPMMPNPNMLPSHMMNQMMHSKVPPQMIPPQIPPQMMPAGMMNKGMVPNAVMFPPLSANNYLPPKPNNSANPAISGKLQLRLQNLARDKQIILEKSENEGKRILIDTVRLALQESRVPIETISIVLNPLVKEKNVESLIGLLENLDALKQEAMNMLARQ